MNASVQPGTNIVMIVLGLLAIVMSFFATGISGAFGSGQPRPITRSGRVMLFVAGLLLLATGIHRMLN